METRQADLSTCLLACFIVCTLLSYCSAMLRRWRHFTARWPLYLPRSWFTVEPIMFLFMFASFLSYPALQQLIHCIICEQTHNCSCTKPEEHATNASESCGLQPVVEQWIEQDTSYWVLYLNLATSLPAIVVALLYGGVSDYYARRKPFILLPALGAAVNAVLVLILLYTGTTLLPLYLIGSLAAGLFGSSAVFNFAVYSYIADTSSLSKRTIKVGILESMTYFGATLSSSVGGLWVQNQGFIPPFWAILACNITVVVYVLLALPSSSPKTTYSRGEGYIALSADRSISASCTTVLSAVLENFLSFIRLMFSSFDVVIMIITFFIVEINFMAISDTVVVYALGKPLCWPPRLIGYFLAGKILMNGIASLVVLPLFSWCGLPDTVIIIFGLISGIVSLVAIGSAHVAWVMMIAPAIGALRGCVVPCIRSALSKTTPPHQQGVLFSGISVVESVCMLLGSLIYNPVFSATRSITPGFCFYVMATALIIPLVLTLWLQLRGSFSSETPTTIKDREFSDKPLL